MFCYQCEQTSKGKGCDSKGVCGKDSETAALQDLLIHGLKGVSMYAHRARANGRADREVDVFTMETLFATVTNVNFDPVRLVAQLRRLERMRDRARQSYETSCAAVGTAPEPLAGPATFAFDNSREHLLGQAMLVGIEAGKKAHGDTVTGLGELVLYGVKGTAAYADHAYRLGAVDDDVFGFFHEALDFLTREHTPDAWLAMALRVGEVNLRVMEILDTAHTGTFGHPAPTQVPVTARKGKAILVSGHDLRDLKDLLEQTRGKGINIYTHGEMLPAHGYPELHKYPHLVGNYGGAWQDQAKEFDAFPGVILMTTNCIQEPRGSYKDRLFTCGLVAWPGVQHIEGRDFGPVIAAALRLEGFPSDEPQKTITVGFGHHAVLGLAATVVEAVKAGAIRHFLLVGGCDGAKLGRDYYTEIADKAPADTVILTLACGKYRFNKHDFGAIGGIPRLLDLGQCNDAYSAIKIATALADAFGTDVNGLPLSMILSWYEQKAVCILLTLLHLGIKNIRLGPSLPAFLSADVIGLLVEKFGIKPVGNADEDLAAILSAA